MVVPAARAADKPIRVLVWDEQQPEQKQAYGTMFLGETIAAHLGSQQGLSVKTARLDGPEQGLDAATLDATDVVIWWGHVRNTAVNDELAERIVTRVQSGRLGFVALHSAHWAKPFIRLMQERAKADALALVPAAERGTVSFQLLNTNPIGKVPKRDAALTPSLTNSAGVWQLTLPGCIFPAYRGGAGAGHLRTLMPEHPIAAGLPALWDVPQTEMYDEPFHVPKPDAVIFEERWDTGEYFRSGSLWQVGGGKVFYFRPGHETYPIYKQAEPLRVLENAVRFLAPAAQSSGSKP